MQRFDPQYGKKKRDGEEKRRTGGEREMERENKHEMAELQT